MHSLPAKTATATFTPFATFLLYLVALGTTRTALVVVVATTARGGAAPGAALVVVPAPAGGATLCVIGVLCGVVVHGAALLVPVHTHNRHRHKKKREKRNSIPGCVDDGWGWENDGGGASRRRRHCEVVGVAILGVEGEQVGDEECRRRLGQKTRPQNQTPPPLQHLNSTAPTIQGYYTYQQGF